MVRTHLAPLVLLLAAAALVLARAQTDEWQDPEQEPDARQELEGALEDSGRSKSFVDAKVARQACHKYRGAERRDRLNDTYLRHCNRYRFDSLLSVKILDSIMHDKSHECERIVKEFVELDNVVRDFDRLFERLLSRYNCHNGYSVKWNCDDCKRAYTDWLCATNLPYYMNGEKIRPCISFCERVEQRCPYLHPITKEQYGGQPVFICRDPNIPYVPEITPDIPYGDTHLCYDLCHISDDQQELDIDSLSRYDHNKCPRHEDLAFRVKSAELASTGTANESVKSFVPVHLKNMNDLKAVKARFKFLQQQGHGSDHYSEHSSPDFGGSHGEVSYFASPF